MALTQIDPNWIRWCHQSIVIHFNDRLKDDGEIYIEGRKRPKHEKLPRFELRIDGPMFNQISQGVWYLDVKINLLILTDRDDKDVYNHQRLVGLGVSAFSDVITVREYENGSPWPPHLGYFQEVTTKTLGEKVAVMNFGQIDKTNQLVGSTAEGHYRMCLKDGSLC